jgi:hypothetical protein
MFSIALNCAVLRGQKMDKRRQDDQAQPKLLIGLSIVERPTIAH